MLDRDRASHCSAIYRYCVLLRYYRTIVGGISLIPVFSRVRPGEFVGNCDLFELRQSGIEGVATTGEAVTYRYVVHRERVNERARYRSSGGAHVRSSCVRGGHARDSHCYASRRSFSSDRGTWTEFPCSFETPRPREK